MNKALMVLGGILVILILTSYYFSTHTFDYLECKDIKEGLTFLQNPAEARCDCHFVSNQCYNTMRVIWTFDSETNETLEIKQPHKTVFKDWGLI